MSCCTYLKVLKLYMEPYERRLSVQPCQELSEAAHVSQSDDRHHGDNAKMQMSSRHNVDHARPLSLVSPCSTSAGWDKVLYSRG